MDDRTRSGWPKDRHGERMEGSSLGLSFSSRKERFQPFFIIPLEHWNVEPETHQWLKRKGQLSQQPLPLTTPIRRLEPKDTSGSRQPGT